MSALQALFSGFTGVFGTETGITGQRGIKWNLMEKEFKAMSLPNDPTRPSAQLSAQAHAYSLQTREQKTEQEETTAVGDKPEALPKSDAPRVRVTHPSLSTPEATPTYIPDSSNGNGGVTPRPDGSTIFTFSSAPGDHIGKLDDELFTAATEEIHAESPVSEEEAGLSEEVKPKQVPAKHTPLTDEQIIAWLFCSNTQKAIEFRQSLAAEFKEMGENMAAEVAKDVPYMQPRQDSEFEEQETVSGTLLRKRQKRKDSVSKSMKVASSLGDLLSTDSGFTPDSESTTSIKTQLKQAMSPTGSEEGEASKVHDIVSEHLIKIAIAKAGNHFVQDPLLFPKLPDVCPFEVDSLAEEYCVPTTVHFRHNKSTSLDQSKREKLLKNDAIGLFLKKQFNRESRDVREDQRNFTGDMDRSNLTIQVQLDKNSCLPIYSTAVHRGHFKADHADEFASKDPSVSGAASSQMNQDISETVSSLAFKLAPGSERAVASVAHQGLCNETYMGLVDTLGIYASHSRGISEGANVYLTFIDSDSFRVDVIRTADQAVDKNDTSAKRRPADVKVGASILVKQRTFETDGEEQSLWVPVSAHITMDAETAVSKKSRKGAHSATTSRSSLLSTEEQVEFGHQSTSSLKLAMSRMKRATSDKNVHKVGLSGSVSPSSSEDRTSSLSPEFQASAHVRQHSDSQVTTTTASHVRQFSDSLVVQGSPFYSKQMSESAAYIKSTGRKVSSPMLQVPLGRSGVYGADSGSSSGSSLLSSTVSSSTSLGVQTTRKLTEEENEALYTLRDKMVSLTNESQYFEHEGQWYISSFASDEFSARVAPLQRYERHMESAIKGMEKGPSVRKLLGGTKVVTPEIKLLASQLSKITDGAPTEAFLGDAKVASQKAVASISTKGPSPQPDTPSQPQVTLAGKGVEETDEKYRHQWHAKTKEVLAAMDAYPKSVAARMGLPSCASKLSSEQFVALTAYLSAMEQSKTKLNELDAQVKALRGKRMESHSDYISFIRSMEEIKAQMTVETDKVRLKSNFDAGLKAGELLQTKETLQEKPLFTELNDAIGLEGSSTEHKEIASYLELKKYEVLASKSACSLRLLEGLMLRKPEDPELCKALQYDRCAQLINSSNHTDPKLIGASALLDVEPVVIHSDFPMDTPGMKQVSVSAVAPAVSVYAAPLESQLEVEVPKKKPVLARHESIVLTDEQKQLRTSLKEILTSDFVILETEFAAIDTNEDVDLEGLVNEATGEVSTAALLTVLRDMATYDLSTASSMAEQLKDLKAQKGKQLKETIV